MTFKAQQAATSNFPVILSAGTHDTGLCLSGDEGGLQRKSCNSFLTKMYNYVIVVNANIKPDQSFNK